jgi:hypothetical protein
MSLDINLTGVEKTSNKKTNLTDNSDTFYPTQKAVKTAVDAKFNTPTGTTAQYLRGDGSLETFPTIPDASDFVEKSDFTSHSILAKQSGASDPVAVSIGNNEILGRKSGGGSNIEGLSVSETKAILNYTTADIPDSTNKRYVTDEVASQWTLHDVTPGSVTSGTSNTISKSILLPDFGSILKLEKVTAIKTGTNAVFRMRVYLSEVNNNIGGTAILLAIASTSNANNVYLPIERIIEDIGGQLRTIGNTANQFSDMIQSASRLDVAKLTGSPLYLIVAVQCDSGSDSARFESAYITNH